MVFCTVLCTKQGIGRVFFPFLSVIVFGMANAVVCIISVLWFVVARVPALTLVRVGATVWKLSLLLYNHLSQHTIVSAHALLNVAIRREQKTKDRITKRDKAGHVTVFYCNKNLCRSNIFRYDMFWNILISISLNQTFVRALMSWLIPKWILIQCNAWNICDFIGWIVSVSIVDNRGAI